MKYDPRNWPTLLPDQVHSLNQLWGTFPNAESSAEYEFFTRTIRINACNSTEFESGNNDYKKVQVGRLLVHEITHWADHLGTVWGQTLLIKQLNSVAILMRNKIEEFHKILNLPKFLNRHLVPTYFTTFSENWLDHQDGDKWKATPSSGAGLLVDGTFSEEVPVFFLSFENLSNGAKCRFPLTALALLEVRAEKNDIFAGIGLTAKLDTTQFPLAEVEFRESISQRLYNPLLIEYLCCVHLTANTLGIEDPLKAYEIAASIAGVALNLLPNHFATMPIPEEFAAWGRRPDFGKANNDRGFAFISLLYNYRSSGGTHDDFNHDLLLASSHLPKEGDFKNEVSNWMAAQLKELEGANEPALLELKNVLTQGLDIQSNGNFDGANYMKLEKFPPICLSDKKWKRSMKDLQTDADFENFLKTMIRCGRSIYEFQEACANA